MSTTKNKIILKSVCTKKKLLGTNLGDTLPDTGPLSGEKTVFARSSTEQPSNEAAF